MSSDGINEFLLLIRNQFRVEDREIIAETTDLKTLKEWSSLQTMIIVSEIDKKYDVILGFDDIKGAGTVAQLFHIVQSRLS